MELPGPALGLAVTVDGGSAVYVGTNERAVVDLLTLQVTARSTSAQVLREPDTANLAALSPDGTRALVGSAQAWPCSTP